MKEELSDIYTQGNQLTTAIFITASTVSSAPWTSTIVGKILKRLVILCLPLVIIVLARERSLTGEQNLIYTAPTGGGKSLVANVLVLESINECPTKKGILVLPYVALVQEKLK
jgi:CRISPR/Cas system-associated endonuclease/helicase Cas3